MRTESLGKRATFLIPSIKVYNSKYSRSGGGIAKKIHDFLLYTFGGYTSSSGNKYGYFHSVNDEYDELREYRVAFKEDEQGTLIPKLKAFLAALCYDIEEECLYLELGEDAFLIYP